MALVKNFPLELSSIPQTRITHDPQSFLERAREQLRLDDFRQATEKLWGSASLALGEIASQLGYQTQSHNVKNLLFRILVSQCVDSNERKQWTQAWRDAQFCHKNFYDDSLNAEEVNELGEIVQSLVEMMTTIDLSKFDKQKFERGCSK